MYTVYITLKKIVWRLKTNEQMRTLWELLRINIIFETYFSTVDLIIIEKYSNLILHQDIAMKLKLTSLILLPT